VETIDINVKGTEAVSGSPNRFKKKVLIASTSEITVNTLLTPCPKMTTGSWAQ